ncbi:MAG: hypothetical protein WAV53_09425, partial [Anaerolineae bacterium]
STLFELARDPAHGATAAPHDPPAPRPRTLHITMPPSANAEEDKRRLTQIYDLMRQHRDAQSRDRFVVYLTQSARRLMLDFPNDPVTCNHALQATLAGLVGWESVRVEATAAAE